MKNSRVFLSAVFATVFLGVPMPVHGLQASPQVPDPHHHEPGVAAPPSTTTPDSRKHMMQMMSEMKAGDAKLDEVVQAMNAATGPAKVDAIAAVVTALVKEHAAMHSSMAKMGMTSDTATDKPKP